jgi:hypothetical protein
LFAPNPLLRILRDVVVLPILRSRWVQRRMFGKLSQLHVHYRRSSLSIDDGGWWPRRRIRAGDRAPDIAFRGGGSNGMTTLFQLMESQRPVVLFNGVVDPSDLRERLHLLSVDAYALADAGSPGSGCDAADLVDIHGDFATLYGLGRHFICLLRPDGHVGFIQLSAQWQGLLDYLKRLCDPTEVSRVFASGRLGGAS